jgi:hypothetical protein
MHRRRAKAVIDILGNIWNTSSRGFLSGNWGHSGIFGISILRGDNVGDLLRKFTVRRYRGTRRKIRVRMESVYFGGKQIRPLNLLWGGGKF